MSDASREEELSFPKGTLQAGNELAAKHAAQHFDREEKRVARANPVLAVERETTDRDHAVDMRMMLKVLAPGSKITALVLGWVEDLRVQLDSRGFGVA